MPSFIHTKVDPDRLRTKANNISECILRLNSAFSAVEAVLTGGAVGIPMLPIFAGGLIATWSGPASQQFFAQYTVDKKLFQSQMRALSAFNDQLKEAAGIFDGADSKARDLVNQLRIG